MLEPDRSEPDIRRAHTTRPDGGLAAVDPVSIDNGVDSKSVERRGKLRSCECDIRGDEEGKCQMQVNNCEIMLSFVTDYVSGLDTS